jgi:hypothetical protein
LGSQPHLLLLAAILIACVFFGGGILGRRLVLWWRIRHAQVGADHIDDGLTLLWGVLR